MFGRNEESSFSTGGREARRVRHQASAVPRAYFLVALVNSATDQTSILQQP